MSFTAALVALALSAFVSATLFPGASEAGLAVFVTEWPDSWFSALTAASLANTAGSITSYLLGRLLPNRNTCNSAVHKLQRYGAPALFFSWLPFAGDALPVAAGWLRLALGPVIFWIALGKTLRYAVVIAAVFNLPHAI